LEAATITVPVLDGRLSERLDALFREASDKNERVDRSYVLAGHRVRMRFANDTMFDVAGRAFGHLIGSGDELPELTIDIWDSASSGVPAPPLPAVGADAAFGAKFYYGDDRLQAHFQPASGALSVFDRERNHAWYWFASADELPSWERAASIRQILHWWLPSFGIYEVHGGAIGTEAGGVLLVGRGGSGKSTTALLSLGVPGMRYVADDYVAVSVDPEPYAHSLYSSGKLEPGHAERLPHLTEAANVDDLHVDDKAVFYVNELFEESIAAGFPLRAVLLPTIVSRQETRLVEVAPTLALAALAPSTLLQLHPPSKDGWAAMAKLVRCVPCVRIELGSDLDAIPKAIVAYLEARS